jgi:hypothetical protein
MNQILRIEYESNVLSEVIDVQSVSWVFGVRDRVSNRYKSSKRITLYAIRADASDGMENCLLQQVLFV